MDAVAVPGEHALEAPTMVIAFPLGVPVIFEAMSETVQARESGPGGRNLVLFTFDQWRGDWCDPGSPVLDLPNVSALAADGWTARCYATSPQCVPARLSWTTGLYPSQLGVTTHRNIDLPPDAPSIVRDLRDRGWWTELVGKSHLTAHIPGRDLRDQQDRMKALGFERTLEIAGPRGLRHVECELTEAWRAAGVLEAQRADLERRYASGRRPDAWAVRPTVLPASLYPDLWLTDRAEERMDALPTDRPWLLWISFVGPHEPFDTPPPWSGMHRDAALPPATREPDWIARLPARTSARRSRDRWSELTPEAIDGCRRDYADHIRLLDDQIGRLVAALSRRRDAGRTAIALTGDHGELLGDGGMLYKGTFLEGAVRVPWIYRPAPDEAHRGRARTDHPLGITPLLGRCLNGLHAGHTLDDHLAWASGIDETICEFDQEIMMVRGGRKLVADARGRPLWATDLDRDPHEQHNCVGITRRAWWFDPAWRELRRRVRRHCARRRSRPWTHATLEDAS